MTGEETVAVGVGDLRYVVEILARVVDDNEWRRGVDRVFLARVGTAPEEAVDAMRGLAVAAGVDPFAVTSWLDGHRYPHRFVQGALPSRPAAQCRRCCMAERWHDPLGEEKPDPKFAPPEPPPPEQRPTPTKNTPGVPVLGGGFVSPACSIE